MIEEIIMSEKIYDLIIIGGGPAGYIAAERAGSKSKKVLLIEKEQLGGVCLNHGCIPTKSLLHSAKIYYQAENAKQFGVDFTKPVYNLKQAMIWKEKTIERLRKGIEYLMKQHHVTVLHDEAHILDQNTIGVGETIYKYNDLVIATGALPVRLPIQGADLPHVLTSRQILHLQKLPKSLVIIGGGVIGLEFASYFSMLGVPVNVIEIMPEILPGFDQDIASLLRRSMRTCSFHLGCKVESIDSHSVYFKQNDKQEHIDAEIVLMAVGRKPNVNNIGLDRINLKYNRNGIQINDEMKTNIPGIYAIGDVTGKSLLAHSAYRMGEIAVSTILGGKDRMRYSTIPWVVYTNPEVSGVGLTEEEAVNQELKIKKASLPMRINGRFLAEHGNETGICKVIVDSESDRLLGVHMIGGPNSEIIYGAAAMIESQLRVKKIKEIIFPHPTVSEIIKDVLGELS
jgi:dihydrolipoamide dehydrogenase